MFKNKNFGSYIIAEAGVNHNGSIDLAKKMIDVASEAGADAIKIQTYTPNTMTIDCDNEYFQIGEGTIWEGKSLYELYGEAYMPWEWIPQLILSSFGIDLNCPQMGQGYRSQSSLTNNEKGRFFLVHRINPSGVMTFSALFRIQILSKKVPTGFC